MIGRDDHGGNVSVTNNTLDKTTASGLLWWGETAACSNGGGVVSGNMFTDVNSSGGKATVEVGMASTESFTVDPAAINIVNAFNLLVEDNTVVDDRSPPLTFYGIEIGATSIVDGDAGTLTEGVGVTAENNTLTGNFKKGAIEVVDSPTTVLRGNAGYNPVGPLPTPTMPASGTLFVDPFYVDCMVTVKGGTVSDIAVNSTSTGQTSGVIAVPAGGSIALTYSSAPTWSWTGN